MDFVKVIPINKRLIIKRLKKEEKPGSLIILENDKSHENYFEIVNVSDDSNPDFNIGDKVYIDRYSNHAIQGADDLFIIREENVIGIANV